MATTDRRTRRTRAALRHALVELAVERGFGQVTVEEVTERADVGRATFYTHFRDKEALYDDVVSALIAELAVRTRPDDAEGQGFTGRPLRALFVHAAEESAGYRMILRGDGDGRARRALVAALVDAAESVFRARVVDAGVEPRMDLTLLARAWVGEQVEVLLWWLESDGVVPLDEVVDMLADLSRYGRRWATGFAVDA
ncbi:MAG: helix-turn-helix domain-containing protein [Gordonia sp. (in: high G+C Gram-positive bacteria)]|uniref:TetR/AcrR family transcriptional regulator n=1 Tax=Gordonia sp. (in: high G+C Gram-positive bacteria) TaxID=84139 RepID=UPI003C723E87